MIQRGSNDQKQYYLISPAPLAQALEMERGETIEWIVKDRETLLISGTRRRCRMDELPGFLPGCYAIDAIEGKPDGSAAYCKDR